MYYKATNFQSTPASLCAGGKSSVLYRPGRWAWAPQHMREQGYYLTVFASLRDLVDCARVNYWTCQVWVCEARLPVALPPFAWCYEDLEAGQRITVPHFDYPWPDGTMMFEEVRLRRHLFNIVGGECNRVSPHD